MQTATEGGVIKPYFTDGTVTIYHGDCREILPHIVADVLSKGSDEEIP